MGLKLKNLFKKKPGGTLFGNLLRTGVSVASSFLPAASLVNKLLPSAPPLVQETANDLLSQAIKMPALSFGEAKSEALTFKSSLLAAGASPDEASKISAVAVSAMQAPENQAVQVLAAADQATPANGFVSKDEIKKIVDGALQGAMDGGTGAYLNETAVGKAQKKGAINSEGAKIMPWALLGAFGFIGFLLMKRN